MLYIYTQNYYCKIVKGLYDRQVLKYLPKTFVSWVCARVCAQRTRVWACMLVKPCSQECALCFVLFLSRVMNKSVEISVGYKILWLLPPLPSVSHSCCLTCLFSWTSADKLWAILWEGFSQRGNETLSPTTCEQMLTVIWMILEEALLQVEPWDDCSPGWLIAEVWDSEPKDPAEPYPSLWL